MTTFLITLFVLLGIVAVMAVGVIFGREPIKGSCGGLGAVGIDGECEICGGNPAKCENNETYSAGDEGLAYNADKLADKSNQTSK